VRVLDAQNAHFCYLVGGLFHVSRTLKLDAVLAEAMNAPASAEAPYKGFYQLVLVGVPGPAYG
jgi:hypothetical protein